MLNGFVKCLLILLLLGACKHVEFTPQKWPKKRLICLTIESEISTRNIQLKGRR